MNAAIQGLIIIIIGIGGCLSYFYLSNQLLDKVLFPPRGKNAGDNITRANLVRPWLFLFPAIFMMGVYIAYPVFLDTALVAHRPRFGWCVCRSCELSADVQRDEILGSDAQQHVVAERRTRRVYGVWPPDRPTDGPHCLGQHRQVNHLHAHNDFYEGGAQLPVGGMQGGHKGYALSLMMALFGGILGQIASPPGKIDRWAMWAGSTILVIDLGCAPLETIRAEVQQMMRYVQDTPRWKDRAGFSFRGKDPPRRARSDWPRASLWIPPLGLR